MPPSQEPFLTQKIRAAVQSLRTAFRVMRERGPGQVQFWFLALIIGIAAGFAALLFRLGIEALQRWCLWHRQYQPAA